MPTADSALDHEKMARARALLAPPERSHSIWPVLSAAAFLALSALVFATAMVMAPPLVSEHVASGKADR
jgi:hypothetical protein